jgi:hypothetical protein
MRQSPRIRKPCKTLSFTEALNKSNIRHQVVFSSESVTGITAAVSAGVAAGVVGERSLRNEFKILTLKDGFPSMPDSALILECCEGINKSISQAMSYAIREVFGKDRASGL